MSYKKLKLKIVIKTFYSNKLKEMGTIEIWVQQKHKIDLIAHDILFFLNDHSRSIPHLPHLLISFTHLLKIQLSK